MKERGFGEMRFWTRGLRNIEALVRQQAARKRKTVAEYEDRYCWI
jgi:hypothetical protein